MSSIEENELLETFEKQLCLDNDSKSEDILRNGEIPTNFASFECPFTWKYDFISINDTAMRIEDKLSEQGEDTLLPWKSFILNLILCYEYAKDGNLLDAIEKQTLCDDILDDTSTSEDSPTVMGVGLKHISLACKCFLMYASNEHDEAEKICNEIVPFDNLDNKDKASILCAKGAFCSEYGYAGIQESVGFIRKALDLDKRAEWFFLLGRSLSRLRRLEKRSAIPDRKEIQALEAAVRLSDHPSFRVLLAQTYRETASSVFQEKKRDLRSFKPYIDSLNQKSLESYRIVLKQGKDNPYIFIRCALGLMKLPHPWKDLNEAKACSLKALDLAPKNPMANHVAGTYFKTVNDYKEALHYLSKAAAYGVFGAEMDLIKLKRKQNNSYNPLADFDRLLHTFKEKPHQESILCDLGSYYYKIENDFKTALKYWLKVIEEDINSYKLRVHFDCASAPHGYLNINKVVMIEIMKLLEEGNLTETERQLYDEIITKLIVHHPGLVSSNTDIDVSKYKNREFKYSSWKAEVFCKTLPYSNRNKCGIDNVAKSRCQLGGKIQDKKASTINTDFCHSKPLVFPSKSPSPDIDDIKQDKCSSTSALAGGANSKSRGMERRVASSESQSDSQSASTAYSRGKRLEENTFFENQDAQDMKETTPSNNRGVARGGNVKKASSTSGVPHSSKKFYFYYDEQDTSKDNGQRSKEGNNIPVESTSSQYRGHGRGRGGGRGRARARGRGNSHYKQRGGFSEKGKSNKTEKNDH